MFSNVLIGVDGQSGGRDAIALAKQLAAPRARFVLAHICGGNWTPGPFGGGITLSVEAADADQLLAQERDAASLDAELVAYSAQSFGRGLHEVAERYHADLLVIGSSRHGLVGRVLMGDQTRASLNGAPCAVAVAPSGYATSSHALTKLGVGYDRSAESERALAAARELAARRGSAISALSVVSLQRIPVAGGTIPGDYWPEVVRELSDDEQERMNALDGVHGKAIYGLPGEELARFGDEVDLLIIGSRGYGPLGRLVHGSTSNHLARHAHCPLLILPRAASVDEPSPARADAYGVETTAGVGN
ncbi:MAG: universal stress protein [Actinomycetota bacterium]|nr:universal stress protein [Actinomycetota bacterium]